MHASMYALEAYIAWGLEGRYLVRISSKPCPEASLAGKAYRKTAPQRIPFVRIRCVHGDRSRWAHRFLVAYRSLGVYKPDLYTDQAGAELVLGQSLLHGDDDTTVGGEGEGAGVVDLANQVVGAGGVREGDLDLGILGLVDGGIDRLAGEFLEPPFEA